ncbi:TIGR04283 family arsenosugar biosynthesis glycosyltransferase [Seongchinamella unica]|uniref:TIGR04283 family arsenosugar biosynthesis glycosyltransferase n=1 Tax=Seongchinamella unica TaxID=2547392 RepID=UPI001EEDBDD8|nr:TIGR04283 family arsenosugar biosynthesis glycosyltransferase [Seongchinamella unica]
MAPTACSFIIPTLDEAGTIADLLSRLRSQYPQAQLVVVDGGSSDATCTLARPLCDQLLQSLPGRARQMNAGLQAASGDYLFFLHADSRPSVSEQALAGYLGSGPRWGFCHLRLSGGEWQFRLISAFINGRSRVTRVATGDQMLFFAREELLRAGGFDDIPLMEDVAICKRFRRQAAPLVIAEPVTTSSRRWRQHGVVKTVVTMWALRLAYALGVSPQRLWRHYYGGSQRG